MTAATLAAAAQRGGIYDSFREYSRDKGTGRFKPKGAPDTPTFDDIPPGWTVGSGEDLGELVPAISDEAWSALDREAQQHLASTPDDQLYAAREWPFQHARIRRSLASGEPNQTSRDFLAQVAGAPPVDGITYRGVHGSSSLNQDRAYWDDHVGDVMNWQVPSSSSLRPDVAARQVPVPGSDPATRPRTIFEIRGKGNYIGAVTGGRREEVVMPAGRYRIRSVHSGRVRQTVSIGPGLRGGEAVDKVFPGPDDVTVVRLEQL